MHGLKASVAKAGFQRKTADNQRSNDEATRSRRNGARGNVDRYVTTECGSEAKRNKFEDNCWPTLVCASPTTGVNLESQLQKKVERLPSNTQMLRSIAQRHASANIKISERPSNGI